MNPLLPPQSMPDSLTLGIDVGTSATKVLLLRRDGQWEMASWPSSEGVWNNRATAMRTVHRGTRKSCVTTHLDGD